MGYYQRRDIMQEWHHLRTYCYCFVTRWWSADECVTSDCLCCVCDRGIVPSVATVASCFFVTTQTVTSEFAHSSLFSVQCNAWHWTDTQSLECMSIYPSVWSTYRPRSFVQSTSNWECRSHIWQQRLSSMASNTGSSKHACASNYFRFSSLLGFCPWQRSHFLFNFYQIWCVGLLCRGQEQTLLMTQPEVIYVHARNLTSFFY